MLLAVLPRQTPHFSSLSALRFFAAVAVAFGHTMGNLNRVDNALFLKLEIPSLMVLFHVLSGFTLASIYPQLGDRAQTFRFWLARIGRIWPVHLLVLMLIIIWFPNRKTFDAEWWWGLFTNVTLTQSWFPFFNAPRAFNAPAWTLSTELALYLLFPFLIQRWQKIWCWALPAFFLLALSVTTCASHSAHHVDSLFHRLQIIPGEFVYLHPSMRLFEFSVGMTLALFWKKAFDRYHAGALMGTVVEVCALALALTAMLGSPVAVAALDAKFGLGSEWCLWLERMLLPLAPFACLIFVLSLNRGWISRAFGAPWLVFLGELSYTIYVLHTLLIWLVMRLTSPGLLTSGRVGVVSIFFWCGLLAASHLLYTFWEQPWRRFFRNLLPHQEIKSHASHRQWRMRVKP